MEVNILSTIIDVIDWWGKWVDGSKCILWINWTQRH